MTTLEVRNLSVSIGKKEILKDISLSLRQGQIVGLVGHNGAGKSTLLQTIIGTHEKEAGEISLNEYDQAEDFLSFKKHLSYLPEEPILLAELTVEQHFQLYGMSYRISSSILSERIKRYVKGFELEERLTSYPGELSKGMRQKAQIICSFLPRVPFLFIDEPFMGLDIYAIDFFKKIMLEKVKEGAGILLTTHQLEQVKELADEFVMLKQGEIIKRGSIDDFETIQRGTNV